MPIPKTISKEDIIKAFHEIDKNGVPLKRKSIDYFVEFNDKKYPPKYVISIAHKYSKGKELPPEEFISTEARRYLKNLGFKIIYEPQEENIRMIKEEIFEDSSEEDFKTAYDKFKEEGKIEFITFHPSYSYEEFIEGITVHTEKENVPTEKIKYILKAGIFKEFCKRALGNAIGLSNKEIKETTWQEVFDKYNKKKEEIDFAQAQKYVLIIDEINRGDISKIFGELITLVEADKRLGEENELIARLPCSNDKFGVPPNIYIIGTMNTADRSIALLDVALRRRFGFVEMSPDFSETSDLIKYHKEQGTYELVEKSINAIKAINNKICGDRSIGRDKQIGHSFLFKVKKKNDLIMVWEYDILPLLEEYCYSNYNKINLLLFETESDSKWITNTKGIVGFQSPTELDEFLGQVKAI